MFVPTGAGFKILIKCDYVPHHDWMAFASWYSIIKNMPEATVDIFCQRGNSDYQLFNWARKQKVKFAIGNEFNTAGYFCIDPQVIAVDYYQEDNLGPIDCKSDLNATFVSYYKSCGKFVSYQWLNTLKSPFSISDKFQTENMTLNENKILKMWKRCHQLYSAIA